MKIKLYKLARIIAVLLFIIAFNNCDKDFEASEKVENITASENSRFHVRTGNNVSKKAITFLKERTDNTLKVSLSNKSIVLSKSSFTARETAMGTVDTSKEIAVDNEYNTKHTFKVINDGDPNTVINVIVVETADVIYEYFKKYSFQNNLPLNPDNTVNLNLFTGIIETYNSLGELTGALQVINGEVVNSGGNNDPCPDNDGIWDGWDDFFNQLNNNTSSGNNGGTNTDDGSNTSNGNTQGGGEYTNPDDEEGCTVYEATTTCWCNNEAGYGYHSNHVNESTFLVVRCGNYVVTTAQRNSNLTSRNPEDENPCGEGDTGVLIDIESHANNCEELQRTLNNLELKNNIATLKNLLNNDPAQGRKESGFKVYEDEQETLYPTQVIQSQDPNGTFKYILTPQVIGAAHLHPEHTHPMFSFYDLYNLYKIWTAFENNGNTLDSSKPFLILTTLPQTNPQTYAIKIEDIDKLATFMENLTVLEIESYERKLESKYRISERSTSDPGPTLYQKTLLKFISEKNIGISLYQANDDLSAWSKKELSPDGNHVIPNNCNE